MRTWAEINLDNLSYNLNKLKQINKDKEIMCVVKADAYGHGAIDIVNHLLNEGIKKFGVACVDEASELRKNLGNDFKILVLGCTPIEEWERAIELNVELSLTSFDEIEYLEKSKIYPNIHLKIDTGMGRVGFRAEEVENAISIIKRKNLVNILGVFSHLSSADLECEDDYTKNQLSQFVKLNKNKIENIHILNSAGILRWQNETPSNMVRAGLVLYGVNPCETDEEFKPILTLKSKILFIKECQDDSYISYQKKYLAKKGEVIATIPIGYADGLDRRFSNKGFVKIGGVKAKIVGTICMDQLMVKIPEDIVSKVKVGDEVVIYDYDYNKLAESIGTISYEMLTSISPRVVRIYYKNGKELARRTLLGRIVNNDF